MTKYIKIKVAGCLLFSIFATLSVQAQQTGEVAQNTPAAIERMKMESLWIQNTSNAAGAMLDQTRRYSSTGFGYTLENGTYKRPQAGKKNNAFNFATEGGGIFDDLHGMYAWGTFSYTRSKLRDAEYNASLIDPFRGMPFILADRNKSNWINQDYSMSMRVATPMFWDRVIFGLEGAYQNAMGAKQMDPRPKVYLSQITVKPSVLVRFGNHSVGATFDYYNRREDGAAQNSVNLVDQSVWEMRGPGFGEVGMIGGMGGVSGLRICNANNLGGGLQYSFMKDDLKVLLSGNYDYKVEDVTNSYTRPKMVGTIKDEIIVGKLAAEYRNFFLNLEYFDRSIDGIEYIQVYDNSYDVQKWITTFKSIRSNYSTKEYKLDMNYLVTRGNAYSWKFGVKAMYQEQSDIYYMPCSTQDVNNFYCELNVKKNFDLGPNQNLLLGVTGMLNRNTDEKFSYTGPGKESLIVTDFLARDYAFRCSSYAGVAGSVTYSNGNLINQKAVLFVSADVDYRKINKKTDWFSDRTVCSFHVGLNF